MQERVGRAYPDERAKVGDFDHFALHYLLELGVERKRLEGDLVVGRAIASDQLADRACVGIGYHDNIANVRTDHAFVFFLQYLDGRILEGMSQSVWRNPDNVAHVHYGKHNLRSFD